jgi:predicted transcriptional regulator
MGMNRIEIEVIRGPAALGGFKRAWRRAATGKASASKLAFGNLVQLFSAITEKRLELVRHVAMHGGLNTRKLATALKRDYKNVYMDVQALCELGLLDKDERGRLIAPFDEIVIRAGLREAA